MSLFEYGKKLWDAAVAVAGTKGETYLKGRKILLVPGSEAARFHPVIRHTESKREFPALIWRVTGVADGADLAFQVLWLAPDGETKAPVERKDHRRTYGSPKGGVVRFAEPEDGKPLLIGEGGETVLTSIDATGYPGWATLGTSGLAALELPDSVKDVVLLAENDEGKNERALNKVCPSLVERGVRVCIACPPSGYKDFNDVTRGDGVDRGSGLMIVRMAIDAAQEWQPKRGKTKPKATAAQSSQANFLVELAVARCELFCDPHGEAYASFSVGQEENAHRETHKLRSRSFNLWLRLRYYAERNGSPSSEAMSSAIKTIAAKAHYDGVRHDVYLRVASLVDKIYVDLCDAYWRAIEIDADGYRIIEDPPVYFRREVRHAPFAGAGGGRSQKGHHAAQRSFAAARQARSCRRRLLASRRSRRPLAVRGGRLSRRAGSDQDLGRFHCAIAGRSQRVADPDEAEGTARGVRRRDAFAHRGLQQSVEPA